MQLPEDLIKSFVEQIGKTKETELPCDDVFELLMNTLKQQLGAKTHPACCQLFSIISKCAVIVWKNTRHS